MVIEKHNVRDRFGGLDADGFMLQPSAYDCYACHYGVSFTQSSFVKSEQRYFADFRETNSVRFYTHKSANWSAAMHTAATEELRHANSGFHSPSIFDALSVVRRL